MDHFEVLYLLKEVLLNPDKAYKFDSLKAIGGVPARGITRWEAKNDNPPDLIVLPISYFINKLKALELDQAGILSITPISVEKTQAEDLQELTVKKSQVFTFEVQIR